MAQGDFSQFLKADKRKRGELLEKITGTEIYRELSILSFEKAKEEKDKLERITENLGLIESLSEEELDEVNQAISEHQGEIKTLADQIGALQTSIDTHQKIQQLTSDLSSNEKSLSKNSDEFEALQKDLNRVKLHNQVLPLQSEIFQHQTSKQQVEKLSTSIDRYQKDLNKNEIKQQSTADQIQERQTKFEKAESNLVAFKPKLKEVQRLNEEISKQQETCHQKRQQVDTQKSEAEKIQKELEGLNKQNGLLIQQKEAASSYLSEHAVVEDLASDLSSIEETFEEGKNKQKELTEQLSLTKLQNKDLQNQLTLVSGKAKETNEQLTQLIDSIQPKHQEVSSDQINELEVALKKSTDDLFDFKEQKAIATEISKLVSHIDSLASNEKKGQEELSSITKELDNNQQKLEIEQLKFEELDVRFRRQEKEASYDDDRQKLEEGEPCPLCGSTHHPYAESYEIQLSQTEVALNKQREVVKELTNYVQKQEKELAKLETSLSQTRNEQKRLNEDKSNLEQQLTEKTSLSIDKLLDEQHLKALETNKAQLELQVSELKNDFQLLQDIKTLDGLKKQSEETLALGKRFMEKISAYKPFVPSLLISHLSELNQTYQQQLKLSRKLEQDTQILDNQVRTIKDQHAKVNNDWSELKTSFAADEEVLKSLLDKKDELIGDKDPNQYLEELEGQRDQFKNDINQLKIDQTEAISEAKTLRDNIMNSSKELDTEKSKLEKLDAKLDSEVLAMGLDSFDQMSEALLDQETLQKIEETEKSLLQSKAKLEAKIKELANEKDELVTQLPEAFDYDQADQQLHAHKAKSKELQTKVSQDQYRLQEDEQRKLKHKGLIDQQSEQVKVFHRWEKLAKLIGQATGDRFSVFAQNLTLQHLLVLANQQLTLLTDRYELYKDFEDEKKDELYVRDLWQGGVSRAVSTLSGGESFILSLALALGLSAMASKNVKIRSLFIDEGFGTLDQGTLDTVLDALEKLQYRTNCQIGVISHVEMLKERITTQIQLNRKSSGYSEVEVVGR